jgi:hypothetical protein
MNESPAALLAGLFFVLHLFDFPRLVSISAGRKFSFILSGASVSWATSFTAGEVDTQKYAGWCTPTLPSKRLFPAQGLRLVRTP